LAAASAALVLALIRSPSSSPDGTLRIVVVAAQLGRDFADCPTTPLRTWLQQEFQGILKIK
jgi:hypothetical protein